MVKTIGNISAIVFLSMSVSLCAVDLSLRMVDSQGVPLTQAGAGQPFYVEVSVGDVNAFGVAPHIVGLDQFEVASSGTHINSINGRTTAKYKYEVRIDKPGVYTIGPAELHYNRDKYISNELKIVVGEQAVESGQRRKNSADQKIFLRLHASKKRVVVGEPIACSLRFYYNDDRIVLRQLIEQEMKQFSRKNARGPYAGSEKIDGVAYQYVEWQWDVYPKEAGKLTIPAYGADYERESQREDFWGGLGKFFGNRVEVKRVYSNAATVDVESLPESKEPIQGVGSFSAFTVQAHPAVAKQGEGIVVTVSIVGDGDPDQVQFTGLQDVPDALKCYESKQSVQEPTQAGQPYTKNYEYVVQGLKTGSWHIPAQTFYYYDVRKKKFVTLTSAPVILTIMPGMQQETVPLDNDTDVVIENDGDILPLATHDTEMMSLQERVIPWWIIYLLMIVPMIGMAVRAMMAWWHAYSNNYSGQRLARQAYKTAHNKVMRAKKANDASLLYTIINQFFADKKSIAINNISLEMTVRVLQSKGFDEASCARWENFYTRIAERAFSATGTNNDTQLFYEAEQWLNQLSRIV